jgi:aminoglycoside phosphotransferase (APT) family kinase protein
MQRLDGPTMLGELGTRPWTMRSNARLLADLIAGLERIPRPSHELAAIVDGGDALVHLDLHPDNVVLTADGPIVIDWSNAAIGVAGLDAANTWLTLAAGRPDGSIATRTIVTAGRHLFVRQFVSAIDRGVAIASLPTALQFRERDPNLSDDERAAMRDLVARVT